MSTADDHRRCIVHCGEPVETRRRALEAVAPLDADEVLWVGTDDPPDRLHTVRPSKLHRHLGESFDAVVLELHDQFDANLLGQSHGLVRGGGGLVLRLPPEGESPDGLREGLVVHPYEPKDVGTRFWRRLPDKLAACESTDADPLSPPDREVAGTDDQARVVDRLVDNWRSDSPTRTVVTADRGRGKSSALGLAVREWRAQNDASPTVAVTARYPDSTAEIFRFALDDEVRRDGPVRYTPVSNLFDTTAAPDLLVVDEAAQFSVPVLRRLTENFPDTDLAFATTTHGYEGTGRGFTIRFVDWLADRRRPLEHLTLDEPIRWGTGDPLERLVFDALLLDAEHAELEAKADVDDLEHRRLDRDTLADDETMLRQLFGLFVQAHYRTTPGDLHRMLDAPNLHLHALLLKGNVVAATWAAEEGNLPDDLADEIYWGHRIRGHALPEILLGNLGHRGTGDLEILRSVRTAVHPYFRRRGFGTRLIEHVHATYDPDLFGTIFGATPEVLRFRGQLGHEIIRISPSRGRRAGEPSVAMARPASPRGRRLVDQLREEYARKLPIQLDLMRTDGELNPDKRLVDELRAGLPDVSEPLDEARSRRVVAHFADGPPTYESAAFAVEPFVERHADRLDELPEEHRRLIEARVRDRASWAATTERASVETIRAAMRGLRRAVRQLVERAAPDLL
jgi:tRNA(Met) cytidine acetyltransferase